MPSQIQTAQRGVRDSPQTAYEDFMEFGRDERGPGPDTGWVRYYVTGSRHEIYDWLTGLGVRFEKNVLLMPGNRVPRWHKVIGGGLGFVEPVYHDCMKTGNVSFSWNTKAAFPTVLRQPGSTYWAIFDSAARGTFFVSG